MDPIIDDVMINNFNKLKKTSIDSVQKILDNMILESNVIHPLLNKIIEETSLTLVNKWKSKKKILRTTYIYRVIPNYPEKFLELSILIDAIVNLLDDLYDEILTKEQRGLVIIELLRLLPFLTKSYPVLVSSKISDYFSKIFTVAIMESIYKQLIEETKDFDEKLNYFIECYACKSKDIDLFVELPLIELDFDEESIKKTVSLFNTYRALQIISKDIIDINHDLANQTYTPIILLMKGGNDFKRYMNQITNHYYELSRKYVTENDPFLKKLRENVVNDIQTIIKGLKEPY
jgi:hypothetical protein